MARRWNIDPETKPDESPYAVFANNPIRFQDPDGRDTVLALEIDIEIIHLSNLQIRAELSALKVSIAKAEMDQLYLELENLDQADRYADLVANGKLNPLKPGIRLLEKFRDFRRVEIGKQLDKLKAEAGVEVDNYQKLEEEYSQAQKSVTTLLEKATVVVIGVNSDGIYAILHKNNDKYKGAQSVYEIDVNEKKYKYGKADDSKKSATKKPSE